MAARTVTYIDTSGTAIVTVGRARGRVPALRGRFVVSDGRQLQLLEAEPNLRLLEYVAGAVQRKAAATVISERQAELEQQDLESFGEERHTAMLQAVLVDVNQMRAAVSLPPRSMADWLAAYEANLAAARAGR